MKVILSRKGFDCSSGGMANAVLPSGQMIAFPIPDESSKMPYSCIDAGHAGLNMYQLLQQLGCKSVKSASYQAHLDPDIVSGSLNRDAGWQPAFGQMDAALSHLMNQRVGFDSLFLFYGWFRHVKNGNGVLYFDPSDHNGFHAIYGYLHVGSVYNFAPPAASRPAWLFQHPHTNHLPTNNQVFILSNGVKLNWRTGSYET